jgi:hypothetical protein
MGTLTARFVRLPECFGAFKWQTSMPDPEVGWMYRFIGSGRAPVRAGQRLWRKRRRRCSQIDSKATKILRTNMFGLHGPTAHNGFVSCFAFELGPQ